MSRNRRSGFEIGDRVEINELAFVYEGEDYSGRRGFITDIENYPEGCEPPFIVDFGNRETAEFYHYELEKV